jgi:hypothetical protein
MGVADDDLTAGATNNTTMSDNFGVMLDNVAPNDVLGVLSVNVKPNNATSKLLQAWDGGDLYWRDFQASQKDDLIFYVGFTPFDDIANLFEESEDGTLKGTADTVDVAGDSGTSVRLDAATEGCAYSITGVTDLPVGRYLCLWRMQTTSAIAGQVTLSVYNTIDATYLNEERTTVARQLTTSWAYYQQVFDITDADSGDAIHTNVYWQNVGVHTSYVDYVLIVPIGNGDNWPQDIAHNALREISGEQYKLFKRMGDDRLVG